MDIEERIRQRAYEIWLAEGQPEGRADENWDIARREIEAEDAAGMQGMNAGQEKGDQERSVVDDTLATYPDTGDPADRPRKPYGLTQNPDAPIRPGR